MKPLAEVKLSPNGQSVQTRACTEAFYLTPGVWHELVPAQLVNERVLQLEKMLADSQQQVWELQNGLRALIDGTLLDDAGNRGENGLRDWVRRSSTPETVVNHWLEVSVRTLVQGSK